MRYGIDPLRFWDMSYADIMEYITGCIQRDRDQMRARAVMDHALAQFIGVAFNCPKKLPKSAEKAYPGLFRTDKNGETDWRIIKANMSAFAQEHNKKQEVETNDH